MKIRKIKKPSPRMYFERTLWKQGINLVAGVDEVGIGALAGPVVACAVIFPKDTKFFKIRDSKKLTAKKREILCTKIKEEAFYIGIGRVNVRRINKINNIYNAGLEAMKKAVSSLRMKPEHILVDARKIPGLDIPQYGFNNGDELNFSIAAASIVAKVYRDGLMRRYSNTYPEYRFDKHKGYATPYHIEILRKIGPCKIHRTSYEFVKGICGRFSGVYFEFDGKIKNARLKDDISYLEDELLRLNNEIPKYEWSRLRKKLTNKKKYLRYPLQAINSNLNR